MSAIDYSSNTSGGEYIINASYELLRDGQMIAGLILGRREFAPTGFSESNTTYPNLTWVDEPPGPGTFTYVIRVNTISTTNLMRLNARTRSLNAVVFNGEQNAAVTSTRRRSSQAGKKINQRVQRPLRNTKPTSRRRGV